MSGYSTHSESIPEWIMYANTITKHSLPYPLQKPQRQATSAMPSKTNVPPEPSISTGQFRGCNEGALYSKYLLIDLNVETPENLRLRTNIFMEGGDKQSIDVYVPIDHEAE